jgi:hypothetical protein
MLVMSLLVLLLVLQKMGCLLLAIAALPIGRSVQNHMLAEVAGPKLLR